MEYQGKDVLALMENADNYNRALKNLCISNINADFKKVIDFGAGIGTLSDKLKACGYSVECVEPDETACKILNGKGYKTYSQISDIADNSIQNIISLNVLEHIKNDSEVLQEIYKKLISGGRFFLLVPANKMLYSSFDKKLGHFRRYDYKELKSLLSKCGFKTVKSFYFDSLGVLFAFIYKLVNKKGSINCSQIMIYDKFIFPISGIFDKIFSKICGKNLVFVLTKE